MGKNLKGREIGKGLSQRKDGRFSARFVTKSGKRLEKYFDTLPEARNWLDDARYEDKHSIGGVTKDMTVDAWFEFWINNIVSDRAPNTIRNYREKYKVNIQPVIGDFSITDVKPMHCKRVLNQMDAVYAGSTIRQVYIIMGSLFKAALMNDIIKKHPMDGVLYSKPTKAPNKIKYITVEEQKLFLDAAKKTHNYRQYAFILETGLRAGEMIGLTWDDIDWGAKTLTVCKTLTYLHDKHCWHAGPPKTKASYRTIPLTKRAYRILKDVYRERDSRTESERLEQSLEYIDCMSGEIRTLDMRDLVFLGWRCGLPIKASAYDEEIRKICDKAGIRHISLHPLRHTYATRAIEKGVNPKALQKLLGHAHLQTTMDRYVHVTDESMRKAVKQFES